MVSSARTGWHKSARSRQALIIIAVSLQRAEYEKDGKFLPRYCSREMISGIDKDWYPIRQRMNPRHKKCRKTRSAGTQIPAARGKVQADESMTYRKLLSNGGMA